MWYENQGVTIPPAPIVLTRTENPHSPSSSLVQIMPVPLLALLTENPSPPSSPLTLPLGSSLATLLKLVSSAQCPQGKRSQEAPMPRRWGSRQRRRWLYPHPAARGEATSPTPPTQIWGTCRISGGPHQRSPRRHPWGDHLPSPHQGWLLWRPDS